MNFDIDKLKRLTHYVCVKCGDPSRLGAVKLNKILWLSDVFAYMNLGDSITGERYVKRQFGPVPKHVLAALEQLEAEGTIAIRKEVFHGFKKTEFQPFGETDISGFSAEQIALIDDIVEWVCSDHTARSISDLSHTDVWEIAQIGEEIPHHSMFVCQLGELDEDDMAWAIEEVQQQAA